MQLVDTKMGRVYISIALMASVHVLIFPNYVFFFTLPCVVNKIRELKC